jgi:polysaccharide biosynthesis/export protein
MISAIPVTGGSGRLSTTFSLRGTMKNQQWKLPVFITFVLFAVVGLAQTTPAGNAITSTAATANSTPPEPAATKPELQTRDQRYRLVAGDVFDIEFDLSPEFNQPAVTVQPDGFIFLRGVGDVKVEGQTMTQLRETIRNAYANILHDPIISIALKDFQKPFFVADGQVEHPGKYELHGPVTLTEAIAIAGGFLVSAKHSQVVLYHRLNDQWTEARLYNVKKMENLRDLKEDPVLHPGDMLFVPKNRLSKVQPFIPTSNVGMAGFTSPI